ncbi:MULTISPECIES: hypothetical protein [Brevibacillus]|uniref:hypothetical protein n=1 Tax=Brevibacillus TaxID=55080 RepID=UPI001268F225|nr:hypothetical protein [Brevibacillus borstelensis]MCM3469976.1 hypothetical protein [Brevibacillus borstelensis]MED1742500.1 hypothetical protein [Brevibacillus borstelensis]
MSATSIDPPVADHWEVVLVTTAGVALTVGGVFFPPLLPFGVSILVGEGISGVIGYAFGMRGDELLPHFPASTTASTTVVVATSFTVSTTVSMAAAERRQQKQVYYCGI